MRILNDDTLLGYEGESYNRIIKIEIEEKYKDYDVYLEFHIIGENKYYTSTKLDTNVSEYLIPYELLKKKNYVDVQLVAYFGADIVSKSDKKLFIVKESINAVDIIINEEGGFKNFKEIIKDELKEYVEYEIVPKKMGDLNNLNTSNKNTLVEAINEVNGKCKFNKTGNEINIYIPSKKSTRYMRYKYMLVQNTTDNMNQWKVMDTNVCDSNLNVLFNLYTSSNNIEWEGVVREQNGADFLGGYHGDENNVRLNVMVDGVLINNSIDYPLTDFTEIVIVNESLINTCNTPNDNLFRRYKISTWNKDNYIIRNRWISLQNNIVLDRIYMTMLSLPIVSGNYNVATYGRYDDKYIIQSATGEKITDSLLTYSHYAKTIEFWGNDFYAKCTAKYDDIDFSKYWCFGDRSQNNIFKGYWWQDAPSKTLNINDEINGTSIYEFLF